jgi:hypothetical protein
MVTRSWPRSSPAPGAVRVEAVRIARARIGLEDLAAHADARPTPYVTPRCGGQAETCADTGPPRSSFRGRRRRTAWVCVNL